MDGPDLSHYDVDVMKPAAFTATYSDFKLIRTRKCVQIVFEVPLEAANAALAVLGGMPNSGEEIWCAVARLEPNHATARPATEAEPPKRKLEQPRTPVRFDEMTMTAQAGMLAQDAGFQRYMGLHNAEETAEYIRSRCGVTSRRDIQPTNAAGKKWLDIVKQYRLWQLAPRVGAA